MLTGFAGDVPTVELMRKQQTLKGLIVGSREQQQDMVRALEQFAWRPVIDSCYPLAQMAEGAVRNVLGWLQGQPVDAAACVNAQVLKTPATATTATA